MERKVVAFKKELSLYNDYIDKIKSINQEIEYWYDVLGGVGSVDPSKEPMHVLPDKDREYKIRDKITFLDNELTRLRMNISSIDKRLEKIEKEFRIPIIRIFVNKENSYKVANELNVSQSTMLYRINVAIRNALI